MTFRRRTFPEVLDNLLTAITGGVSAESHPFPPPGDALRHNLQQPPVGDVISVYGSRDGEPHLFRKTTDYALLSDKRTLEWQQGAELPDPGTLVLVNYYPASVQPVLTDLHVGSVVRTLAESVALEMARLYAQLEVVYDSGFIDTATGSALDNVVSLLGMERVTGGRPAGEVEFTRAQNSPGTITVPSGTRIITADGSVEYETVETVTLLAGQNTIRVIARDLEPNDPLPADVLTVLPVPIADIASVTNPAPTSIDVQDETDAELRTRAKNFLHGSERATLGAINHAIIRQGVSAEVTESDDEPGVIEITLHAETVSPELAQRIKAAIDDSKPAGVIVREPIVQAPAKVDLDVRLITPIGLLETDYRAAQHGVRDKIADYFGRLPAKEVGSINKLVGLALSVPGVDDVRILSARIGTESVLNVNAGTLDIDHTPTVLGNLRISDPNLATLLLVTVRFPEDEAPADKAAIQSALSNGVATINTLNASELPEDAPASEVEKRVLSFAKMLHLTPLSGKAAGTLDNFNSATAPDSAPPYAITYTLTLESGLSQILTTGSPDYTLTPFERLSLSGVEVQMEVSS